MTQTFKPVWFRKTPFDHRTTLWIGHDTGTLVVGDVGATFTGRQGRVYMTGITRITQGRSRPDWTPFRRGQYLDDWIRVDHGNGDIAILHDGGFRGWRGLLGGNERIIRALQPLVGR